MWAGNWEPWGIPRLGRQSCPTARARRAVGSLGAAPGAPLSTLLGTDSGPGNGLTGGLGPGMVRAVGIWIPALGQGLKVPAGCNWFQSPTQGHREEPGEAAQGQ